MGTQQDVSNNFWVLPLFRNLLDLTEYLKFCKENNITENDGLAGTKYFFYELLKHYCYDIQYDSFMGLEEDDKTYRAFFVGLALEKMPISSEKAIFVKNIRLIADKVKKANNFERLQGTLYALKKLLHEPLDEAFNENTTIGEQFNDHFSKERVIEIKSIFKVWINMMNIDHIAPLRDGLIATVQPQYFKERRAQADKYFLGYRTILAFIFKKILIFDEPIIWKDLIDTKEWEELQTKSDEIHTALDELEKAHKMDLLFKPFLVETNKPDKKLFTKLLDKKVFPKLDLPDEISEALLWYDYEVITSARSKIFSGVPIFVSLMMGELLGRSRASVPGKLKVIKFEHESELSYGILIERYGSGWLIFYKCAGLRGAEYIMAESAIGQNRNLIDLTKLKVDSEFLYNYFGDEIKKYEPPDENYVASETTRKLRENFNYAQGQLLEFITKAYFEEKNYDIIYFKKEFDGIGEIDLVIRNKTGSITLIECSLEINLNPAALKEDIDKIKRKRDYIAQMMHNDNVNALFVTSQSRCFNIGRGNSIYSYKTEGIGISYIEDLISELPKRYQPKNLTDVFTIDIKKALTTTLSVGRSDRNA